MEIVQVLQNLCMSIGVAGDEKNASNVALDYLKEYAKDAYIDDFNNVIGWVKKPSEGQKTLLLDAHIDEIGMVVTAITDKGFVKVSNCGGVDIRTVIGQEVCIHAKKNIKGVVCTLPPHLAALEDTSKYPDLTDIAIDIGMSKEQAEKHISAGDTMTVKSKFVRLLGDKISCKAQDDRACAAIILNALSKTKIESLNCGLAVVFSAQEEVGGGGAKISSYNLGPTTSIALDVTFAHTPAENKDKCGEMGKGVMIGISPLLNRELSHKLIDLAKANNIAYQIEVMSGRTGTNSDSIFTQRGGVCAGLLSLPIKYMHTPVEVLDLKDIDSTTALLVKFIEQYE